METRLIVDDRERAVIAELRGISKSDEKHPFAESTDTTPGQWEIARLGNGDFTVIARGETIAVIERKTYSDFAQSIKDGRMDNLTRVVNLVRASGSRARVGIILEGTPPRTATQKIDGIPVANIYSKIAHLWLRDDVYLVETKTPLHTAIYLRRLLFSAMTLIAKTSGGSFLSPPESATATIPPESATATIPPESATATIPPESATATIPPEGIPIAMRPNNPPDTLDDAVAAFSQFPGIGPTRAKYLLDTQVSIASYVMRDGTKYSTSDGSCDAAILSAIYGVSRDHARELLSLYGGNLRGVCLASRESLMNHTFRRKHAGAAGERVYKCLHATNIRK